MANRLDEQLHEACRGIFSHRLSLSALAGGLSLVSGELHNVINVYFEPRPA